MADYYGKTRTNYFSVTDEEKFKQIMGSCRGADDIEIIDNQQQDGSLKYGFYCEGSIYGLPERDEDAGNTDEEYDDVDYNYDAFCEALQQILPDDDAVLITEVGYPWECEKCGSEGNEYGNIVFDGHCVNSSPFFEK